MKKPFFALGLIAGAIAISRLPDDTRQRLAKTAQTLAEHCPWHKIMSGVLQIQRQNEKILSLLKSRNEDAAGWYGAYAMP